jgi:hypothetical protein
MASSSQLQMSVLFNVGIWQCFALAGLKKRDACLESMAP